MSRLRQLAPLSRDATILLACASALLLSSAAYGAYIVRADNYDSPLAWVLIMTTLAALGATLSAFRYLLVGDRRDAAL